MDISVVICTYNRSETLKLTLESFLRMEWDNQTKHELIVVDNNSTDDTKQVIMGYIKNNFDTLKYVMETMTGLSYARNKGIEEANGKIVAFADDDVDFDRRWGQEIVDAFQANPDAGCLGGKNIPFFIEGKPEWIPEELYYIYGDVGFGDEVKILKFPEHPYGLNMAFKKEVFEKVGLFNPELGRKKLSLLSGEESELFYRVNQLGMKTIYTPFAVVKHLIPPNRTGKEWILKRVYWGGISEVVFEQLISTKSKKLILKEMIQDIGALKKGILGNYFSPKKIYWHIKRLRFEQWAHYCYKLGIIRQKCLEIFTIRVQKNCSNINAGN